MTARTNHRRQAGSTLLEGLIAITVFSIALLGLAGLQVRMSAHGVQSQLRVQASYLAEELIGLATADAANAGCYVVGTDGQGACGNAIAEDAAADWLARVQAALPGTADHAPSSALTPDGRFTVTILWQRPKEETTHNYTASTNLYTGLAGL